MQSIVFFKTLKKLKIQLLDSNASKDAVVSDQVSQFADDPYINAIVGEALGGLNPRFLGMEGLDPSEFMDLQKSADGLGRKGIMARKKLRNLQEKQSEEIEKANEFESEMAGITAITESSAPKGKVAGMPESAMDSPYLSDFNPRTIADFSNFRPKFRGSMGMQEGGVAELPLRLFLSLSLKTFTHISASLYFRYNQKLWDLTARSLCFFLKGLIRQTLYDVLNF